MKLHSRSIEWLPRLLLACLIAAIMVASAAPADTASASNKRIIKVMTRNLYLGTPLDPILSAPDLPTLFIAVAQAFGAVQATNPPERMEAIAAEIEAAQPDLVGLQEVSLWRTDTPSDGPATPAETVAFDFLQLLLDELSARGLSYAPVAVIENFDGEVPAGLPPTMDVRLTDRDVILARTDLPTSELKLSNPQAANFSVNLTLPSPVGPLTILRGWTSVDVKVRGKPVRVVNTHLETDIAPPVQVAQATELLAGPGGTSLPILFLGDFNSRADGTGTPTYGLLLAAGFLDAWSQTHPGDPGFTCCQAPDLLNPLSLNSQRIDLVLHRGGWNALDAEVVGEDPADRTPSGRWPSDHAGVASTLQLEKPGR